MKPSKRGLLIAPLRAQTPYDISRAEFEREVTIVIVTVKSKYTMPVVRRLRSLALGAYGGLGGHQYKTACG